jgi:hypothetical protein
VLAFARTPGRGRGRHLTSMASKIDGVLRVPEPWLPERGSQSPFISRGIPLTCGPRQPDVVQPGVDSRVWDQRTWLIETQCRWPPPYAGCCAAGAADSRRRRTAVRTEHIDRRARHRFLPPARLPPPSRTRHAASREGTRAPHLGIFLDPAARRVPPREWQWQISSDRTASYTSITPVNETTGFWLGHDRKPCDGAAAEGCPLLAAFTLATVSCTRYRAVFWTRPRPEEPGGDRRWPGEWMCFCSKKQNGWT